MRCNLTFYIKRMFEMKKNGLWRYFFSCGAIIYTVGSALILIISLLLSERAAASILAPKPFLFYLGFAYIISIGNTLFKIESISAPVRRLIHAVCYILGLFAFVLLCGMKFAYCAIVAAIFGIIYAIALFVAALIKGNVGRLSPVPSRPSEKASPTSAKKQPKKTAVKEEYKSRFS